jgi:hypothetical protein
MWALLAGGSESATEAVGSGSWFLILMAGAYAAGIGGLALTLGGSCFRR